MSRAGPRLLKREVVVGLGAVMVDILVGKCWCGFGG